MTCTKRHDLDLPLRSLDAESTRSFDTLSGVPLGNQNGHSTVKSLHHKCPIAVHAPALFQGHAPSSSISNSLNSEQADVLVFIHWITFTTSNHPHNSFQILYLPFSKFPPFSLPFSVSHFTHFAQLQASHTFQMSLRLLLDEL